MALYVEPSLARDSATSCNGAVAIWCGFLWVAFGLKYLSELSNQALAGPYTCNTDDFSASAKAVLKLCVSIDRSRCAQAHAMASNLLGTRHERSLFSVE